MSVIENITLSYQEYKAYQQKHKEYGLVGRSYSMIGNGIGQDNEKILGKAVIKNPSSNAQYELKAEYADNFTDDFPFVKITVNGETESIEEYLINIDEINVKDASEIEMFALLSYAGAHENNLGFSSGVWNALIGYIENDISYTNIYSGDFSEKPYECKLDWSAMIGETKSKYMGMGLYEQVANVNKLISIFERYGMPETVEMRYMDTKHWLPAKNCFKQIMTDYDYSCIQIEGNGVIRYINFRDKEASWIMKITQEQLAKAWEIGDEFAMYVSDNTFWEKYLNSNVSKEELKESITKMNQKSTYADAFGRLPDSVKEAWENSSKETGMNGFDIDEDTGFLHLSEFARRYMIANLNNESTDLLGETAESVMKFAKEALEHLEDSPQHSRYLNMRNYKDSEKMFYQKLIEYLEPQVI